MQKSKLFMELPDYICTPDGMAIDQEGNLILSCPNYADITKSGCVVRIDKDKKVSKWFDVPEHPETGAARNMGIAFDSDWNLYLCDNQGWSGDEALMFKGRILKIKADWDGTILECTTVAKNMEHPNGIRIRDGYLYVTQSCLSKVKTDSGKLLSCVYRFNLEDQEIAVTNTLEDANILVSFITENPDCQYGADGIEIDGEGNLLVGNFGDGEVYKISLNPDGSVKELSSYARNRSQLESTDGMIIDKAGNLYIADFSANAIAKVDTDGRIRRIASSPDCDGLDGGLDQPGEPIIWQNKIIVSCFDLVTGPGKVNTAHEMPATLAWLELEE